MKVTLPALSEQECQLHEIDLRRDARKVVGLCTIVTDKLGLARGEVTNISPGGVRAAAYETPEARSVHYTHGVPE
jgi:hypothetical protein